MTAATATTQPGIRKRLSAAAGSHRSISIIIGMALVAALLPLIVLIPPLPSFQGQAAWINGFSNAGVFQDLYFGFARSDLGFNAGLKAFTAAVLGGIGNLTGAALGGFIIGFIEVAATALGYTQWSQAIVFTVLIVVLVFRPAGILGQQIGERA